jgi:AraC-like DNA-binding protein
MIKWATALRLLCMPDEVLPGAGPSRLVRSTTEVSKEDAADYWSDMVCRSLVEVAARPASRGQFQGQIERFTVDEFGFSMIASDPQEVSRTGRLIAQGGEDYAMVNIQVSGQGTAAQDGRTVVLRPGAMTFLDSTRPFQLFFDGAFSQLVVQLPLRALPRRVLAEATAVELSADGPGRLVSDFLLGMERQHRIDPDSAGVLAPHVVGLVSAALSFAGRGRPDPQTSAALTWERAHQLIRRRAKDPSLDADAVAASCGVSRRTLFRALSQAGETTFTSLLRRVRVENVRRALRETPHRSLAVIARECGFGGEAQMYRAFREVTGTTPAAYRGRSRS